MSGETDLNTLLSELSPSLSPDSFVFAHLASGHIPSGLQPKATFDEAEGLTIICTESQAKEANIPFDGSYACITLTVHSSLDAVGLTAAVASTLAKQGISANVMAAYFHDHIFVANRHADKAVEVLNKLAYEARLKSPAK